jgi:hypothetical protein
MIYEEPFRAGVSSTRGAGERAAGLAMLAAEARRSRRSGDLRSVVSGGSRGSPEAGPRRRGHLTLITRRPAWCVRAFRLLLERENCGDLPARYHSTTARAWRILYEGTESVQATAGCSGRQENVERVSEPSRNSRRRRRRRSSEILRGRTNHVQCAHFVARRQSA